MTCKVCGKKAYSEFCVSHKPRKPIAVRAPIKRPTKRIKQRGKVHDEWQQTKANWFKKHYAQHYRCHYCSRLLTNTEVTLDHKIPRSRAPHLRADIRNLVPCCFVCNGLKGSVAHDDYEHTCHAT